jgi:PAS domain S-box-containing protein
MHHDHDAQSVTQAVPAIAPELLTAAVQAIGVSVIVTDLAGVIQLWNRGAEELYGWSAHEVVGLPITTLLVAPSAEADAAGILAPLASGTPWSGEFPVHDCAGRAFSARIWSWPIRDGAGAVVGFVGLSQEAGPDSADAALLDGLAAVLHQLLSAAGPDPEESVPFDADAAAIEIVTRGLDPELRAAADADPHGTVLPADGLTLSQLDDLLASLVALAVHTATAGAARAGCTTQDVVAAAALRLRSR